uniref:TATA box-binding protein-like 1 n=1 Tax=Anopheles epiroticus TaxID=199890 RepID=A0A182PQC2_9DIPT
MVGNSALISNAISTSSAPNGGGISGTSGTSSSTNSINITGSSTIVRNGISFGGRAVLGVNTTHGNNEKVVSVAKAVSLRHQHHTQHPQTDTSGGVTSVTGGTSTVISVAGDLHRHHQSIVGGMINHSSLMFATTTTNHQQQLSVISNAVGDGAIVEKKTATQTSDSSSSSSSSNNIVASNTSLTSSTTTTPTTITTNTPTETDPTSATELETKESITDNEPQEEQPEIDIVINNVVCSFSVRCHLNLHEIARQGNNVEFRRENGMVTMKLRRPYTTASIWSSGKITCTGATSEHQASARRYSRCLQKLGFNVRFRNFRIVNVLGTCSMPFGIMIVNFSEKYKKDASYEPELHPGVTYKLYSPKATLKIFSTGSITVTAASVAFVQAAIEQIFPLVYEFRKKRTPLEKMAMVKQPLPDFDPHDVDDLIEEDREGALAEAQAGLTYWNGTDEDGIKPDDEQDEELETFGDDEDVRTHTNTKAIHKINSIRQNGKKRKLRQYRPSGRAANDGDSMSDDDLCVSDYE